MWRQILAITMGFILSYLAAAASGYFLYRLSDRWPHEGPMLARYVFDPGIALLVGACVGALAKSRPGTLAALSLVPGQFAPLLARRQDAVHFLILVLLSILYLLIGAAAANVTFRSRRRSTQGAPAGSRTG